MKKRILKKREGFTLIIVILGLALMSVFGLAIMGIATSNFKMTKVDSQSQGAYYIAEAGVNQARDDLSKKLEEYSNQTLSHDEFFDKIDQYINGSLKNTVKNYEENIGQPSLSKTSVDDGILVTEENTVSHSKRIVNYTINSEGEIGQSSRLVGTSVNIIHKIQKGTGHHPAFDYAIYSGGTSNFDSAGDATIKGSIYGYDLKFKADGTDIEGNIISENSVDLISAVKVKGNVYAMDGEVNLSAANVRLEGDIHATEKVTLSSGTIVEGSIYTDDDIILEPSSAKVTGAIHSGGNVRLYNRADVKNIYTKKSVMFEGTHVITGDIYSLLGVKLMYGADVQNIYTGGNVEFKDTDASHVGIVSVTENIDPVALGPVTPPDFKAYKKIDSEVPLTNFNIEEGALDIEGPQETQHIIAPGSYDNLTLKWNDTAKFTSGNYYFNEIDASGASIKLKLDLSGGPINIYAKNNITFGYGLQVSVSEDGVNYRTIEDLFNNDLEKAKELAGKVYWETHSNFELPGNCYFLGTVLADDNFFVAHAPRLIGAYAVNKGEIKIDGYNPEITYAPPTDSAAGGSGSGGVEGDKGHNIIPKKDRITIENPIREKQK